MWMKYRDRGSGEGSVGMKICNGRGIRKGWRRVRDIDVKGKVMREGRVMWNGKRVMIYIYK